MSALITLLSCCVLAGFVAIIIGGLLGFKLLPDVLDEHIEDNVRLGLSEAYREWENTPYDIETKIYSFSVTNADAVLTGSLPKLIEKGPVVFKERRIKQNIKFNATSDTFTYDQVVINEYNENSPTKITDSIITLNLLKYLSLRYAKELGTLRDVLPAMGELFTDTQENSLFHTITFSQLLTEGYKCQPNTITSLGGQLAWAQLRSKLKTNIRFVEDAKTGETAFSLFKHKRNYTENRYEIFAGNADIFKQGQIVRINGLAKLSFWPKLHRMNYCNQIRGSDVYNFPPRDDFDAGLTVYNPELCRSVDYAYNEEVNVKGIDGQRLVLKGENFVNGSVVKNNQCYCLEMVDQNQTSMEQKCLPTGFSSLLRCHGIPLIASQPYFLYTNEVHSRKLSLTPIIDNHLSHIDVHPKTGTILRLVRRIQYNIKLQKIEGFYEPKDEIIFPLYWMEESMEIPPAKVQNLQNTYLREISIIGSITWSLLGLGCLLTLGCGSVLIFVALRSQITK